MERAKVHAAAFLANGWGPGARHKNKARGRQASGPSPGTPGGRLGI